MKNVKSGLAALINPQNSEFWGLILGVVGYVATTLGWISHAEWDKWSPAVLGYVGMRLTSKVAKGA